VRATTHPPSQPTASGWSREVYAPALRAITCTPDAAAAVIDVRPRPNRMVRFRYCHFHDCDRNNRRARNSYPRPASNYIIRILTAVTLQILILILFNFISYQFLPSSRCVYIYHIIHIIRSFYAAMSTRYGLYIILGFDFSTGHKIYLSRNTHF
jgi:hypothetical protein